MDKANVLFLCSYNSVRSQMAEGLLRHLAGDRFEAFSAGIELSGVNPLAVRVMAEIGIDISGQRSKVLTEYLGKVDFAYLITVCDRANQACPTFPGVGKRLHWPIADPAQVEGDEETQLAAFRATRDELARRIGAFASGDGPR